MREIVSFGRWLLLTIFDTGHRHVPEIIKAAKRAKLFGGPAFKVTNKVEKVEPSLVFFPMRQYMPHIAVNRTQVRALLQRDDLTFIQDPMQLLVYEDKIGQFQLWGDWMPPTVFFDNQEAAREFLELNRNYPLVSKSQIGSASQNVRILRSDEDAFRELKIAFEYGLNIEHGEQKNYVLWQKFIPHDVTWRVTIVGRQFSVYKRFNYPGEDKAAPASMVGFEPINAVSDCPPGLLDFAFEFFEVADTKYCAIDVIQDGNRWRLLETALSWARSYKPYLVKFIGTRFTFATQMDLLMEEIKAGRWNLPL